MLVSQAVGRAGPECQLHKDDAPTLLDGHTVGGLNGLD